MGLFSFGGNTKQSFPWESLTTDSQLTEILNYRDTPLLFFKHSTRCSISAMALTRFESEWKLSSEACRLIFLDLLSYRNLSNEISERTGVPHQSPQAILILNGEVIYQDSHNGISARSIQRVVEQK